MESKQTDNNMFISTGTEYYHPEDTEQEIRAGCSCFTAHKSAKSAASENPGIRKSSSQASIRSLHNDPSLHLNKHLEPVVPIRRGSTQPLKRVTDSVSHQNSSKSSTGDGSGRKSSTGSGSGSGTSAHSSTIFSAPADQGINLPAIPRS
jgi:hypothetical protein